MCIKETYFLLCYISGVIKKKYVMIFAQLHRLRPTTSDLLTPSMDRPSNIAQPLVLVSLKGWVGEGEGEGEGEGW